MSGQGARPLATHHKGAMSAIAAFFQLAISRVRTSSMPAETSSSTSVPSSSKGRFPQPIAIASRRDGLLKSNHGQMLVPADFRRRLPDGAIVDQDWKSVVEGKSVLVRVDLGGRRTYKNKQ